MKPATCTVRCHECGNAIVKCTHLGPGDPSGQLWQLQGDFRTDDQGNVLPTQRVRCDRHHDVEYEEEALLEALRAFDRKLVAKAPAVRSMRFQTVGDSIEGTITAINYVKTLEMTMVIDPPSG
jgi:hypothetical protein